MKKEKTLAQTKKDVKVTKEDKFKKATKKTKNKQVKKTPKKSSQKSYSQEVKTELKKVKWPTKQEMIKYSVAVIAFIVIFGLYFYGLDALFAWLSSVMKGL